MINDNLKNDIKNGTESIKNLMDTVNGSLHGLLKQMPKDVKIKMLERQSVGLGHIKAGDPASIQKFMNDCIKDMKNAN